VVSNTGLTSPGAASSNAQSAPSVIRPAPAMNGKSWVMSAVRVARPMRDAACSRGISSAKSSSESALASSLSSLSSVRCTGIRMCRAWALSAPHRSITSNT
jgi:hypothetical protein